MTDRRDYVALDWVAGEIAESLQLAVEALEQYIGDRNDSTKLQFCLAHIHQVQGSLRMVEFFGAALLAEEMETCLALLLDGGLADSQVDDALSALRLAIAELPKYVNRVRENRRDYPTQLLRVFNELRAVGGQPLLSGSELLFNPSLAPAQAAGEPLNLPSQEFLEVARKLRQMYQIALLGYLRGHEVRKNLNYLAKVCARVAKLSQGCPQQALWQLCIALLEGLLNNAIKSGPAVRGLLRAMDRQIRLFVERGDAVLAEPPPAALMRNLLFYVAGSEASSQYIRAARSQYALDAALPDIGAAAATQRAVLGRALQSLAAQLEADRSGAQQQLRELLYCTAVLGLNSEHRVLRAIAAKLQGAADAELEPLAQQLRELSPPQETLPGAEPRNLFNDSDEAQQQLDRAFASVVRESRNGLELTREAVVNFVANQWQIDYLADVPALLASVAGSLQVAAMSPAAAVLRSCEQFVREQLLDDPHVPDWQTLDALADALTSVDYYLERCASDMDQDAGEVLAIAEQCVAALGYPVPSAESQAHAPAAPQAASQRAAPAAPPSAAVAEAAAPTQQQAAAPSDAPAEPTPAAEPAAESAAAEEDQRLELPEDIDPEVAEIFVEEAGEVLEEIAEALPACRDNPANSGAVTELRRAFHTLKGSGRMVGAEQIGELAWSVEDMLNRVMEGSLQMDAARLQLIEQVAGLLPEMVTKFGAGRQFGPAKIAPLVAAANALTAEQTPAPTALDTQPEAPPTPPAAAPTPAPEAPASSVTDESVPEASAPQAPAAVEPIAPAQAESDDDDDDEEDALLNIFAGEARIHLRAIENFLTVAQAPAALTDALQRSLHTLKGAAHMAGMGAIADLVSPTEHLVKELRALQLPADVELLVLLNDITRAVHAAVDAMEAGAGPALPELAELRERIARLGNRLLQEAERAQAESGTGIEPGELDRFLAAAAEHIAVVSDALVPGGERIEAAEFGLLGGQVGSVGERAAALNFEAIAELAQDLQLMLQHATDPVPMQAVALAREACETLMEQLNQLAGEQKPQHDDELLQRLRQFDFAAAAAVEAAVPTLTERAPQSPRAEQQPATQRESAAEAPAADETRPLGEDVDPEILGIFLEEAEDLLEAVDETIHRLSENAGDREQLELLQRHLHTLKGGARLAGLMGLGELTHNCEALLTDVIERGGDTGPDFMELVLRYHDRLSFGVQAATRGRDIPPELPAVTTAAVPAAPESTADTALPAARSAAAEQDEESREAALANLESYTPQELIKVSAELMENLVNLAGETSIARSRAEEEISDFAHSLDEMLITVERLQEQVRRLDIETEAQILFRQEQVEIEGQDGFDPLEFDRYSQLQQLSRSLMESASDLVDIRGTLAEKTRDMETLLLQQSRINTELQEGLMRSRMVHFARMVPRLRRIVRQISLELGKRVEFKVFNAEGELDRQVLERIVPPLEHMLRNSVDHGIESEADRVAAGKNPVGTVSMHFAREGGDVLITLSDDGRGIDFDAVRKKAVKLGWIKPDQVVSEGQLSEFLFQSGFSTAEQVTQISGRGVGMDVVHSEIKQLGGSVELESSRGRGTRFMIRLPFTVSVNRALMVSVGGDVFAVPINAIEGIVRVSPYELEVYYQPDAPPFEYAGQPYGLRYLGGLLGGGVAPHLEGQTEPRPVILVRGGDQPIAVQVDSLLGSREIVVKTLGPQFSTVHSLSGATVLGDGSVVVILDMLAMIRADLSRDRDLIEQQPVALEREQDNQLVMVVDDSVTVRKVTSRLLERQGMDVLLAKDGVDAITQLQEIERLPDVILLDIEMPRMDGFEVASRVRHTARLQQIPIIMITSRTGEKHRERAFGLGVNKYLGKPYQELALLKAIAEVTGEAALQSR